MSNPEYQKELETRLTELTEIYKNFLDDLEETNKTIEETKEEVNDKLELIKQKEKDMKALEILADSVYFRMTELRKDLVNIYNNVDVDKRNFFTFIPLKEVEEFKETQRYDPQ